MESDFYSPNFEANDEKQVSFLFKLRLLRHVERGSRSQQSFVAVFNGGHGGRELRTSEIPLPSQKLTAVVEEIGVAIPAKMNLQLLRGKTLPANDVAIVCKWSKPREIMPDECAIDEQDGSAADFMPDEEDKHFGSCKKFLQNHKDCDFNQIIAYFMMEGYLGRINSVEEAYQKGHKIFMDLKKQEAEDTQKKAPKKQESEDTQEKASEKQESEDTQEKASEKQESEDTKEKAVKGKEESEETLEKSFEDWMALSTYRRYREYRAIMRLGFDKVFDGKEGRIMPDLGKLVPHNGAIKTFRKQEDGKQEKCTTLLLDGNRLGREVVPEFFDEDLEHLAYFNPRPRLFQLKHAISPSLSVLVLRGCSLLETVDGSIGNMGNLRVLEISESRSIRMLPDTLFTNMSKLLILNLSCLGIEHLPAKSFAKLVALRRLILRGCFRLEDLPSTKAMNDLEVIDLCGAKLFKSLKTTKLGDHKIKILDLSHTCIHRVPNLINQSASTATGVTHLFLRNCQKIYVLDIVEKMKSLEVLDLSGAVRLLQMNSLKSNGLKILDLSQTDLHSLSSSFLEKMENLLELNLSETKLRLIPDLSNQSKLRRLIVKNCPVESLPTLGNLSSLEVLDVSGCNKLEHLEGLSSCRKLLVLNLSGCTGLKEMGKILSEIGKLTSLRSLNLSKTKSEIYKTEFLQDLKLLQVLDLSETSIKDLPPMRNLKSLKQLSLAGNGGITAVPDLDAFSDLEVLDLSGTGVGNEVLGKAPSSLRRLLLKDCSEIKGSLVLSSFTGIQELDLRGSGLTEFPAEDLGKMRELKSLRLPAKIDVAGVDVCQVKLPEEVVWDINCLPKMEDHVVVFKSGKILIGSDYRKSLLAEAEDKREAVEMKDEKEASTSADAKGGSKESTSANETDGSKLSTSAGGKDGGSQSTSVDAKDENKSAEAEGGKGQSTSADGSKQSMSANETGGSKQSTSANETDGDKQSTSAEATDGSKQSTSASGKDGEIQSTSADATDGSGASTSADVGGGNKESTSSGAKGGNEGSTSSGADGGKSTSADKTDGKEQSTSADAGGGNKESTSSGAKGGNEGSTSSDADGGKSTSADKTDGKEQSTSADATVSKEQSTSSGGEYKITDSHSFRLEDGEWEAFFKKFHFTVSPPNVVHFGGDELAFKGRNFANVKPQGRSVEIHGFSSIPESAKASLKQAINVAFIGNDSIGSLSDLSSQDMAEMKVCWIRRCEEMRFVIHGKNQSFEIPERLETLILSNLLKLKSICDEDAMPAQSIESLKHVYVDCCPALSKIISGSHLLVNLETLHIQFCDGLKFVCEVTLPKLPRLKSPELPTLPNLRRLKLSGLPNLEQIGCNLPALETLMIRECPELCDLRTFFDSATQLTRLSLYSCPKLQTVFSSSMPNLKELDIRSCDGLTTLIENPSSSLPKLRSLQLWSLPKMENVEGGFPSLETRKIESCPRLPEKIWPQCKNRSNTDN